MIEKRTEFSTTSVLPDGKKRVVVSPQVPLGFKEDYTNEAEEWKDIDLTPREVDGKLVVDKAPFELQVFSGTRIIYRGRKRGETLEVSVRDAEDVVPVVKADGIYWENALPETDIYLVVRPSGVEYKALLKTDKAPKTVVWEYLMDESVDPNTYIGEIVVHDGKTQTVKKTVDVSTELRGDRKAYILSVSFEGLIKIRNHETRVPSWGEGIQYPVTIDPTVNEGITTDSMDDGMEFLGFGWYPDGSSEENYVQNGAYDSDGAVRFQTVNVPNGATIDSATITVEIMYEAGSSDGAKIYGDDVDDAPAFSGSSLPSNITKTTASTTLNSIAVGSYPMDVTAIVQELVDRAGWVANNDMRFLIDYTPMASGGVWSFADTGHATGAPATLAITYSAGGGATPAPTPDLLQPISGGTVIASGGGMAL